jgi:hypothetical protein
MRKLKALMRMVLAFPLVFPVFLLTAAIWLFETNILWPRRNHSPLSDFLDKYWLDPWNNFIDYGSFRCS